MLLLDLPHEVLHNILQRVDPQDLAPLRSSCSRCCRFIDSDALLFKQIFLNNFDDPRWRAKRALITNSDAEPDWQLSLHGLTRTLKILESEDLNLKQAERGFVLKTLDKALRSATSVSGVSKTIENIAFHFESQSQQNTEIYICGSSLYKWAKADIWSTLCPRILPEIIAEDDEEIPSTLDRDQSQLDQAPADHQHDETENPVHHDVHPHTRSNINDEEVHYSQLSAKLHCQYGIPIQHVRKGAGPLTGSRYALRSDTAPIHPYVRSKVYDLRQHSIDSFWGPFLADGSQNVDWEKVQAIMLILDYNISQYSKAHEIVDEFTQHDKTKPFEGAVPYSYVPRKKDVPMNPSLPLTAKDPYNITGTWLRIVCFLDYTELFHFNFASENVNSTQPRPPLDTEEATRLITMKIEVTKIEPPGKNEGQALPIVHFAGFSYSVRPSWDLNANSRIKGTVRLTPQGDVRWTTWSVFHGEERWRSEGVQVGGVQSARGVIGYWFDKDFEVHGPAGPTAFWKSHDGIEKQDSGSAQSTGGLHGLHVPLY